MRGYAETEIFVQEELELFADATRMVALLGERLSLADQAKVRCHELARAVGRVLELPVQDGKYGGAQHSWLVTAQRPDRSHILDVYVVGRLPMVQLVDTWFMLPESRLYRPMTLEQLDLRPPVIEENVDRLAAICREALL